MIFVGLLLAVAALTSQQYVVEAKPELVIANSNNDIDNSLMPDVMKTQKRHRTIIPLYVKILTHPEEQIRAVAGESIKLECIVMGNPIPHIRWEKNGQTIMDMEEVNLIQPTNPTAVGQMASRLIINSATPGEDKYSCIGTASVHTKSFTTTVYTLPSEDGEEDHLSLEKLYQEAKPKITYYINNVLEDMGSSVVLPCRAQSLTDVEVIWYDPSENIVQNNSRIRVLPSGDLLINDLRWSDLGNFTCTVKNEFGEDMVTTFIYPIKV